ncbi:MAG: hypothetical protein A2014_03825 [Spirochaetes bacterium GWF1_49_6]|nr:MAG: hypothetical protein A2014_03825 [Spirochaetes bacterium GWF1_49_6]
MDTLEVEFLSMKVPVSYNEYKTLPDGCKNYAFSAFKELNLDIVKEILESLLYTKRSDIPGKEWVNEWKKKGILTKEELNLIYWDNMRAALIARKYSQLIKDVDIAPWWQYIAVMDLGTTPAHAAMHGMIRHYTDLIWDIWFPLNGIGCRCTIRSLSPEDLEDKGINPHKIPTGLPDMKEVIANNAYNPDFERLIKPKFAEFNMEGKLNISPDKGYANNPGTDLMRWLEIKDKYSKEEWLKLLKNA